MSEIRRIIIFYISVDFRRLFFSTEKIVPWSKATNLKFLLLFCCFEIICIYLKGNTTIKGEGQLIGQGYAGVFMGSNSADLIVDGNVMLVAEGITSNGLCGYSRTFAGLTDVEVRLRLERNNKKSSYYILFFARFALTFSAKKLGFASTMKIKNLRILFCIVFGFH